MFSYKICIYICLISVMSKYGIFATRTKDRMYSQIEGTAACFRRLNGTHQFGCSSLRNGNVGVLEVINNSDDLQWLLDSAPVPPYMPVLNIDMFTKPVLLALKDSRKVNGVVLLKNETQSVAHFSHEDTCPNRYSGLSNYERQLCSDVNPWNKYGTSLLMVDWGFPIFYVHNETSISKIIQCHSKYNSDRVGQEYRSLCSMEMKAYMFAAKDSETCIRRSNLVNNLTPVKHCDPLEDRNIWSTIFPRNKDVPEDDRSTIVLSARLDTTALFDGEMPGAGSTVAGLVTALATAQMLAGLKDQMEPLRSGRNVLFALLNGEAYDYIGSSRLVYDMKTGKFPAKTSSVAPMNYTSLRLFVELNQVTNLNVTNQANVFFHTTQKTNRVSATDEVSTFIKLMQSYSGEVKINMVTSQQPNLPPASLQAFVKTDSNLPGVVVTDYDESFSNRFYHSLMDDEKLIKFQYLNGSEAKEGSIQKHLAGLSTALAKTIYEMTTDQKYNGTAVVDSNLVDELLYCYLVTTDCRMFKSVTQSSEKPPNSPPSMYIGVGVSPNVITRYTGQTLAFLTGTRMNLTKAECKNNQTDLTLQYLWMRGSPDALDNTSVCIQTSMNYSTAASPAFDMTDYKWNSGQYSTWTESVWQQFNVRIFLQPSQRHEIFVLSLGLIVLILSFPIVWFISSRSDVLFSSHLLNAAC